MTTQTENALFDFAASGIPPSTDDERLLRELHSALAFSAVPISLRSIPIQHARKFWRQTAYIAAVLLLVVTLIGSTFAWLNHDNDSPGDRLASVPPVVLGLASPSPVAVTECDYSQDVPFFHGLNESPINGTALVLTSNGELILSCDEEQEVLAQGVETAFGVRYPGVLFVQGSNESFLLNVSTRATVPITDEAAFGVDSDNLLNLIRGSSRWVIIHSSSENKNAAVLDLETFEEQPLLDTTGEPLLFENAAVAANSYDGEHLVIAFSEYMPQRQTNYLGGYALISPGQSPRYLPAWSLGLVPRELAVSPDGELFAAVTFQGEQDAGTTTVRIHPRSGANPKATYRLETADLMTEIMWLKSGDGAVLTTGSQLLRVSAESDTEDPAVLVEGENVSGIALTREPNTFTVSSLSTNLPGQPMPLTYIVNVESGEITTLEGRDMFFSVMLRPRDRNVLILETSMVPTTPSEAVLHIHDAATGKELGTIERPIRSQGGFSSSQYGFGHGEMGIVAFDAHSIWLLLGSDHEPMLLHLEPPAEIAEEVGVSVTMSESGWISVRNYNHPGSIWIQNRSDAEPEWIKITFPEDVEQGGVEFILAVD